MSHPLDPSTPPQATPPPVVPSATTEGPSTVPAPAAPPAMVPPAMVPPAMAPPPAAPPWVLATPTARPPRTPRTTLVATAAIAAVLASTGTAGLTWALADNGAFDGPSPVATVAPTVEDGRPAVLPAATGAEPDWRAVADAVRPSVVAIEARSAAGSGQGSGVIFDADGHVLTNDHVAGGAEALRVTLADGRVFDATVLGTDPTTDLAVIALVDPPDDLVPAALGDSDGVAVGAAVMAVGNPLGLDSTVTTGIVSALNRPVSTGSVGSAEQVVTNAIQVDAAINPGNSGGPLFDAGGRVIGITSSIASLRQTGGTAGSIGLGFAIPSKLVQRIATELIADGAAEHAFLGVGLSDGTATADRTTRLGAVVEQVTDGSPAAAAGLRAGDVVVAIDHDPVSGAMSLTAFVRERAAGDEVALTVVRDGGTVQVPVTLATRAEVAKG